MTARFITLNINGLNSTNKQKMLFDFIKQNNLNFICLQEHNIKDKNKLLDMFYEHFDVILNECINLKGGTAILIDKRVGCQIL